MYLIGLFCTLQASFVYLMGLFCTSQASFVPEHCRSGGGGGYIHIHMEGGGGGAYTQASFVPEHCRSVLTSYAKRDLFICQKRPIPVPKETCSYLCQKRPIPMPKETYSCAKRDLFLCQKRPIPMPKETYSCAKRDLFLCQKRPIPMYLSIVAVSWWPCISAWSATVWFMTSLRVTSAPVEGMDERGGGGGVEGGG